MAARRLLILLTALALPGCAALGPQRMSVDRVDYTVRLRESEKAQLLSNIVGMSRGDAPLFLSVTSVISQYTRESSGNVNIGINPPVDTQDGAVGGSILLRESPTITYTPLTGERFARNMLSPVPPASILAMIEAGWSSDQLFRVAVRSINGVNNGSRAPLFEEAADPRFTEVAAALRRLQRSGAVSIRVKQEEKSFSSHMRISPSPSAQDRADIARIRELLGLRSLGGEAGEVDIAFAGLAASDREIALVTRSMFEILGEMAQCVEEPGRPIPEGCLIRVRSGPAAPSDAYTAVSSGGRWYWVDGHDDRSKQVFLLVQVMISLSDDGGGNRGPLVTVPTGG